MLKVRTILMLFLVLFFMSDIHAIEQQNKGEEEFCTLVKTTQKRNSYELNLLSLNSNFERVYFLNQLFKFSEVVVMDSDPDSKTFLIGASVKYPMEHIMLMISDVKTVTQEKASLWSPAQKQKWMTECDKYYTTKK
ncbi:MAG: hypothetical protein U9R32_00230 [Bacteroidota bacterium]|nr:hypothetical protein [Bacteroidota bacterium]